MATFEIRLIPEFDTKQKVNKLFRNGKCFFDKFVEEIKKDKNLSPELLDLFAIIERVANGETMLPPTMYRKVHLSKKIKYSAYEAKSDHLRLYLITERDSGLIFIIGGKKKTQDSNDLDKLEKTIKEFTQYKNEK